MNNVEIGTVRCDEKAFRCVVVFDRTTMFRVQGCGYSIVIICLRYGRPPERPVTDPCTSATYLQSHYPRPHHQAHFAHHPASTPLRIDSLRFHNLCSLPFDDTQ